MKKFSFLLLFSYVYIALAQIPEYYQQIDLSQSPDNIKLQLSNLLRNTHLYHLEYTPQTWIALKTMDLNPENIENVLLIYGYNDNDNTTFNDRSRDKDLSCHTTNCVGLWTREHVYPRSTGNYDEDSWPGTDVHALRPCDGEMNEYRWNSPFVDGAGNAHEVFNYRFYPGDEWKGDVARMVLYMYLRYPNNCLPNYVGDDENSYHADVPDIFLEWNAADPVSDFELNRNNLTHTNFQGNRNPFIDNPYLATIIWGGPQANNTWGELAVQNTNEFEFEVYPNPTTDVIYYNMTFNDILIYDVKGRLIKKDDNLGDNQTTLPEKPGLYFIKFFKSNKIFTQKVIKK